MTTTTAAPRTITITPRTRSIGFAWTNSVEDDGNGRSRVRDVRAPRVVGNWSKILAAYDRAAEENSGGTYWSYGLWVGGVRVRNPDSLRADLVELSEGRSVDVTVVDAG